MHNTSEIGLLAIVHESGVASGVRRIEAVTGPGAFALLRGRERMLERVGELVKSPAEGIEKRVHGVIDDRRALEKRLEE